MPAECQVRRWHQENPADWAGEHIIHVTSDLQVSRIDLDAVREQAVLILVSGQLRVGQVYNEETDGSAGLVILGRMEADDIVVGGQEIFVAGDLRVNGCFWGEYNHGDLTVTGRMHARVFVATDEYHYDEDKASFSADHILSDWEEAAETEEYDEERVRGLFVPEVVAQAACVVPGEVCSWNEWLLRGAVLARLAGGQGVVRADAHAVPSAEERLAEAWAQARQSMPRRFGPGAFDDEAGLDAQLGNFQALMQLAVQQHPGVPVQDFECTVLDASYAICLCTEGEEDGPQIRFMDASRTCFLAAALQPEPSRRPRWFGKRTAATSSAALRVHWVSADGGAYPLHAPQVPEAARTLFRALWVELLERADKGAWLHARFLEAVPPQRVLDWLAVPVIGAAHLDYDDSENNNFNYGSFNLGFRLHGFNECRGSVDIGCELPGEDYDLRQYFLRPDALESPGRTELYYCSSQEERTSDRYHRLSPLAQVFCYDWERYAEMLQWLPTIDRALAWRQAQFEQAQRDAAEAQARTEARRCRVEQLPFEHLDFRGTRFRLITRQQAHERIGGLKDFKGEQIYDVFGDTWRFPDHEGEHRVFLLAEDDVAIDALTLDYSTDEHPELFILGFIFAGNLHVRQTISAYDTDNSPALIVLGEARAELIHLFGNVHYFGSVHCEVLAGTYNHGELLVAGPACAWLIVSDDMRMRFERFEGVECLVNLSRPDISVHALLATADGGTTREELLLPSTHRLGDILPDDLVEVNDDGEEQLNATDWEAAVAAGQPLIDEVKKAHTDRPGFAAVLRAALDRFGNHLASRGAQVDEPWQVEDVPRTSSFHRFEANGRRYRQLVECIGNGYGLQMRAVQEITAPDQPSQDVTLVLDYLDEDGDPRLQWSGLADDAEGLELQAAMQGVLDAITRLDADLASP